VIGIEGKSYRESGKRHSRRLAPDAFQHVPLTIVQDRKDQGNANKYRDEKEKDVYDCHGCLLSSLLSLDRGEHPTSTGTLL
jgi:hypothetical protein